MDFIVALTLTLGTVFIMIKAVQKFPMVIWLLLLIIGICLYGLTK